jgi:anti-sigma factor ChrR (cupin superfamily)
MKILFKDEQRGVMTALFRWQPGAKLPMHEHTDVEQSYVLEGSLCDFEGECKAGDYAWRPAGSKHDAWSPKGCLLLAILLEPNKFLEGPEAS